MNVAQLRVRGGATAEELAVVLAALHRGAAAGAPHVVPSTYELWRRRRLAVVRPTSG